MKSQGTPERIALFDRAFPTPTPIDGQEAFSFKPSEEQVEFIERKLKVFLDGKHPKLAEKYHTYYRQYSGVRWGTHKTIRANFLCRVTGDRWRKEWQLVLDGGDCYFTFSGNASTGEITDFSINGEA